MRCGSCTTNATTGVKTCTYTTKVWKLYYANCANSNTNCRSNASAYLPVITVCIQGL